jgi:GxxExxY protein
MKAGKKKMRKQRKADKVDLDFPHKDLTHKIIGACLKIHNQLGSSYQEKHYQRVLEIEIRDNLKLPYEREKEIILNFEGKTFGKYFVDFVIDGKVPVEIKRVARLHPKWMTQILRYLNTLQMKIGLIINFGGDKLEVKRVVLPQKYLLRSASKSA